MNVLEFMIWHKMCTLSMLNMSSMLGVFVGEALNRHLNRIIPAVIQSLGNAPTADEGAWQSAEDVVLNVQKEPGPAFLIEELVKCSHATKPEVRAVSMHLLYTLCGRSSVDLSEHLPQLIIFTTETLNDPSDEVCEKAWLGLDAVIKVRDVMEADYWMSSGFDHLVFVLLAY